MAGVTIRDAVLGDAATLALLRAEIVRDPDITFTTVVPTTADIEVEIALAAKRGAAYLVALREGDVVGYATWGAFRKGPGYRFTAEHSVHLAPEARGCGVGRKLMDVLIARAKTADLRVLVAGISSSNHNGLRFHRRLGFEEVARMPGVGEKNGRWFDLVLMQRKIG